LCEWRIWNGDFSAPAQPIPLAQININADGKGELKIKMVFNMLNVRYIVAAEKMRLITFREGSFKVAEIVRDMRSDSLNQAGGNTT